MLSTLSILRRAPAVRAALLRQADRSFTSSSRLKASSNPIPGDRSNSRLPLIVGALLFAMVPSYYLLHARKSAGSEQAKILQTRREQGTSNETRDPRDSEVKTLEQKKARDGNK
ncbi:hypothetical protein HRR83_009157 [Exophiala dermatitidis]|nr:hypothetical protein HRR74_009012 [Exophiala dermatitidis]KAJ4504864.1 hypothetical protein HRR73_008618 [Exophiala dermatitidis]KAJ4530756.1 hypothetical protein HRR76_008453 [Exophiala dermatitidis]KAJ4531711.1 hypothetical protein HRR77_009256 [Exophiala dermatitidis]KAJ4556775.1 hypothetical protein HRR79_008947 [Exophiala dermatitidis]